MPTTVAARGPRVDAAGVTFRLPDAHGRLRGVRLQQQLRVPAARLAFTHSRGSWRLRLARPAVDRMEYLLELEHPDGHHETITDPTNDAQVPGAFGAKSVLEFPGYRRPGWLAEPGLVLHRQQLAVTSRQLGSTLHGALLSPAGLPAETAAPLLVVNDGLEYAELGGLTHYVASSMAAGGLPPLRVALLEPADRNRWYAVSPSYARTLATEVLPAVADLVAVGPRIGVGASLGALAMLHTHRLFPQCFAALFLQSGSFFRPDTDPQEQRFSRYRPVTRFVADVDQAVADPAPVPVVMTCGVLEENLANNRAMAVALRRLGYPVSLAECRDVHNYTAWRDALDPQLTRLITTVGGRGAA
jgi:enterochelin esterase-like enzyme